MLAVNGKSSVVQVPGMALAVLADDELEIHDLFAHIREPLSRKITVGVTDVFGSWESHSDDKRIRAICRMRHVDNQCIGFSPFDFLFNYPRSPQFSQVNWIV